MLRVTDLLRISLRQVWRQRKRNLGVMLAIALGTAGLIAVVTMGDEVKLNLNKDLDLLGGVTVVRAHFEDHKHLDTRPQWFREEALEAVKAMPGVELVSQTTGHVDWNAMLLDGREYAFGKQGVDQHYWKANGFELQRGRLIEEGDVRERSLVCVLGYALAEDLFGDRDPVDRLMRVGQNVFRIIGVVKGLQLGPRAEYMFLPVTTAQDRMGPKMLPNRLYVRCVTWDDVPVVADRLPEVLASAQKISHLKVDVSWEHLKRVKRIVWWVELFIYMAIIATLVLGGFGIWNGMMSSVTARTREIGLKKAMGADNVDILAQFLTESICLSTSAGGMGVGLGWLAISVASNYLSTPPSVSLFYDYTVVSLIFSGLLGLLAGFYPALKASRMDVVTAIRYE